MKSLRELLLLTVVALLNFGAVAMAQTLDTYDFKVERGAHEIRWFGSHAVSFTTPEPVTQNLWHLESGRLLKQHRFRVRCYDQERQLIYVSPFRSAHLATAAELDEIASQARELGIERVEVIPEQSQIGTYGCSAAQNVPFKLPIGAFWQHLAPWHGIVVKLNEGPTTEIHKDSSSVDARRPTQVIPQFDVDLASISMTGRRAYFLPPTVFTSHAFFPQLNQFTEISFGWSKTNCLQAFEWRMEAADALVRHCLPFVPDVRSVHLTKAGYIYATFRRAARQMAEASIILVRFDGRRESLAADQQPVPHFPTTVSQDGCAVLVGRWGDALRSDQAPMVRSIRVVRVC